MNYSVFMSYFQQILQDKSHFIAAVFSLSSVCTTNDLLISKTAQSIEASLLLVDPVLEVCNIFWSNSLQILDSGASVDVHLEVV